MTRPVVQSADRDRIEALLQQADDLARAGNLGNGNSNTDILRILEPLVEEPLAADPALGDRLHYLIATAYYRLTKYPEAMEHYRRALDAERAARDRASEARTLRAIGQLHKNAGAYADGIAVCQQALSLYQALGNEREAAGTRVVLGAIRDLMGDHRAALEQYQEALTTLGEEKTSATGNLFNEIGITQKNLGHYAEALRAYERALDIYTQLDDKYRTVYTLLNLGVLQGTLGEYERAVRFSQQALALAREIGERRGERILLLNLGEQYWAIGDRRRALESLEQALPLLEAMGARSDQAGALKTLGDIHVQMGDLDVGRRQYAEALGIQREIGERRTEGSTLIALADLALREGRTSDALRGAADALIVVHETGRTELEWMARRSVARAAAASGETSRAIDELRAAARIINDLRANVTTDASKIAFVDSRQEVFQDLATLLVETGHPDEALEAAEAGRARAFADLLAQRQIVGRPRDRDALAAVRTAQTDLREAAGSPQHAESLLKTRGAALDSSVAALAAEDHELASLVTAESPTIGTVTATAKRLDASLIEYLVTERRLLAWVVSPNGAVHAVSIEATQARIESLTRGLREALATRDPGELRHPTALRSSLRELGRLLIAPLTAWLPRSVGASVIVIPHGPLALVPFAALEVDGQPLVERYTLSYAPAASVYAHTLDKLRAVSRQPRRTLIVADPIPPAGSGLERLPWAREEGRRVAQRAAPARLLAGADASETTVKREAGAYSVLHFATHGLMAADRPLASSLMLAAGNGDDGYLRVDEIFNLDLAAELVVLSGCSTGLGRVTGDGVIGLTRAFMYAGTPTVVVSQWDVSDRATAFLMDQFYAAWRNGQAKASALRTAQLVTRRRYPHAALWAAFTLVGEPQ